MSKRSRNRLEQEKIAQQKVEATREKIEDLEKKGYQLRLAGFQDESEEVDNFNVNWRVEHRCYDFFAFASKHEKIGENSASSSIQGV